MLEKIIAPAATLAAIAAGVLAFWFYAQNEAKADRIVELEIQAWTRDADNRALAVLAAERPRVEREYRDALAAVAAAGERTSDACLTDPRVLAAYRAIGLQHNDGADAPGR